VQYLREYLDTLFSDYSVCMSVHIWKHTHVYLKRHLFASEKRPTWILYLQTWSKVSTCGCFIFAHKILEFSVGFERILRHSIWRHSSKSAHCSFFIWVHVSILNRVRYLRRILFDTALSKNGKSQIYCAIKNCQKSALHRRGVLVSWAASWLVTLCCSVLLCVLQCVVECRHDDDVLC